jgi:hypothetical protein
MIHILKNKQNQFYWLSIVRKGNTYEENAKQSESVTQKHNCEKSIRNEAGNYDGEYVEVVDHTGKEPMLYAFVKSNGVWAKGKKIKSVKWRYDLTHKEVQFVQARHKKY